MRILIVLVALPLLAGEPGAWQAPKTDYGHPDLQGVWANNVATPLQRPKLLADKAEVTEEELQAIEKRARKLFRDEAGDAGFGDNVYNAALEDREKHTSYDPTTGNYNQFWLVDREFTDTRTSLIFDPPNGRIPELAAAGKAKSADVQMKRKRPPVGPEDRSLQERCITYGVPRTGAGYNSYYQIFQTPDHVVIMMEMITDSRVIPLDGRPHIDDDIRLWHGDSRGHWEGDTLVVETRNFSKKANFRNSSENLKLKERFTLTAPDRLEYEITIDDPTIWTATWKAMIPLAKSEDDIFEYACHEGNYSMEAMLSGARLQESDGTDD
jgi:hypothetical protein